MVQELPEKDDMEIDNYEEGVRTTANPLSDDPSADVNPNITHPHAVQTPDTANNCEPKQAETMDLDDNSAIIASTPADPTNLHTPEPPNHTTNPSADWAI
jgi:hypothetical protein